MANHQDMKSITLGVSVYELDDLPTALYPQSAVVECSAAGVASIDQLVGVLDADERITRLGVCLDPEHFRVRLLNGGGEDTELDGAMALELEMTDEPATVRISFSACESPVEDRDGEGYCITGECFTSVEVLDLRDLFSAP